MNQIEEPSYIEGVTEMLKEREVEKMLKDVE